MIVLGREQGDSAIHIHVAVLPPIPLLSRLPHGFERIPCPVRLFLVDDPFYT